MMQNKEAEYKGFQFEVDGHHALAIINVDLKDVKRSDFPYAVFITLVPDTYNEFGHPDDKEHDYLLKAENDMREYLDENTRTVHVGQISLYRKREVIFYTRDKEVVEDFLDYYLKGIERASGFEVAYDEDWDQVQSFYELI